MCSENKKKGKKYNNKKSGKKPFHTNKNFFKIKLSHISSENRAKKATTKNIMRINFFTLTWLFIVQIFCFGSVWVCAIQDLC